MSKAIPGWAEALGLRLEGLSRPAKKVIAIGVDAAAMPSLMGIALALKFDSVGSVSAVPWALFAAVVLTTLPTFAALGLYRAVVRYISLEGLLIASLGALASVLLLMALNALLIHAAMPASVFAIYCMSALIYLGASRLLLRVLLYFRRGEQQIVAVYGAGAAGVELVAALRRGRQFRTVAFLDDNKSLHGTVVAGIRVFAPAHLSHLVSRSGVSSVLLALPSLTHRQRQKILKSLEAYPVHVRTVPEIGAIVAGHAAVSDIRDVDARDLLGRDPVAPDEALMRACIASKVVMVSGAGGSIGSELCRQIVRLKPLRLVLLEMSEAALYRIERELQLLMQSETLEVELIALLGKARHRHRVREILAKYGVQTIYHAAAYKHVPIVEQNIIEGINNNVFSTWNTAEAALESRVETFVLISTDKAVNPTNVMGATKRLAELTLQGLQERSSHTRFCMVRFGNVLESSGSVVPLFREQIRRGGPVTVTHKDMIRYFMTIPEAAQLVLQAGSMAKGGDVFVLDMSEPVRIADLARRMVHLMGLTVRDESNPEGDIEIVYTGLRPAEKLFEELLIGKSITQTEHDMIMRAIEHRLPWNQLRPLLDELASALESFNCAKAREILMQAVAEYRPDAAIYDLVWTRGHEAEAARKKVADIAARRARQVGTMH